MHELLRFLDCLIDLQVIQNVTSLHSKAREDLNVGFDINCIRPFLHSYLKFRDNK